MSAPSNEFAAPRALLAARSVDFAFPGRPLFRQLTFIASEGERVVIVGDNGVGKSTLLRLLAGHLQPQAGRVQRIGELEFIEQQFDAAAGVRVADYVRLTRSRADQLLAALQRAAEEVAAASGVRAGDAERASVAASPVEPGASTSVGQPAARFDQALAAAQRAGAWDAKRRLTEALDRLDVRLPGDRLLSELSVGQRYRLRLACALSTRAAILALDEPTNHLDAAGIEYLTRQLRAWPGTVVVVTHDRQLIDDIATVIVDLDPSVTGQPSRYRVAEYAEFQRAHRAARQRWEQLYQAEQRRLARLVDVRDAAYENLSDEWRPPKGSQKHRRATRARSHVKAADRAIEAIHANAIDVPVPPLRLTFPALPGSVEHADDADLDRSGEPTAPLLTLSGVRVPGRMAGPVDLQLAPGGRLLVVGANGTGKSTLLCTMAGRLAAIGTRWVAPGLRIGYLDQEPSVDAEVKLAADYCAQVVRQVLLSGAVDAAQVVPVLSTGLVGAQDLDRPLTQMSVGQRRRLQVACTLIHRPHLLIFDEPTNHLSVTTVDDLTEALRATPAAVVVATHDRRMRHDLADWPVLDLDRQGPVVEIG